MGTDDLNIKLLHGASELGQGLCFAAGGLIDPEYAMFVAVEGDWLALTLKILSGSLTVAEKTLAFDKGQLSQFAGGIIDKYQQTASRCTPFEPIMGRTIDLYQFPRTSLRSRI